jgi:hypothetical protein
MKPDDCGQNWTIPVVYGAVRELALDSVQKDTLDSANGRRGQHCCFFSSKSIIYQSNLGHSVNCNHRDFFQWPEFIWICKFDRGHWKCGATARHVTDGMKNVNLEASGRYQGRKPINAVKLWWNHRWNRRSASVGAQNKFRDKRPALMISHTRRSLVHLLGWQRRK